MKWSFQVFYRFSDFIEFLHSPIVQLENGEIYNFCITDIEIEDSGFTDIDRGHYVVVFNLIPIFKQLTLFDV